MEHLLSHVDETGVAWVRLNRPSVHNAFDDTLIAQIVFTFQRLEYDENVRMAVLSGEGKSFCAGADLGWMRKMKDYRTSENLADSRRLAEMFRILNDFSKPLIGAVHGAVLGGGAGLAACCDYVVSTADASFGFTEVRLGLVPAVISPFVVAKIGESHARAWFLSGEKFTAEQAKFMRLIHELVADKAALEARTKELAVNFSKAGPEAARAAKKLIADVVQSPEGRESILDRSCRLIAEVRISNEGQEGMNALLTKRKPSWTKEP